MLALAPGIASASTLSIANKSKTEGNSGQSNASLTVTLNRTSSGTVRVNYATSNGTATQPADYVSSSGQLTFTSSVTSQTINVPVKGDTLDESNETVNVGLSGASGATISDGQAVLTINNDDGPPGVAVVDISKAEGDSGSSNADVPVVLNAVSGKTVTVDYFTADGTALEPADYSSRTGTLTFTPGQTIKIVSVPIKGDTLVEGNETFGLGLTAPTNANIVDGIGIETIDDDDAQPTLSVSDVSKIEGDSGTSNADFSVSLSGSSTKTVTVNYATADGTATESSDYGSRLGTLTYTPGQVSKTVSVPINGDVFGEPDETFSVDLSFGSNATIADGTGVGTILDDDMAEPPPIVTPPDTVPPATKIDSGPPSATKRKKAHFTFSSSEPGSTFECALDRASFSPCTSPATVKAKPGRHRFSIRASDPAGNPDPTVATYSWKLKK